MNVTDKKSTSSILIIVFLIIFWPIGIILLIKKLTVDKAAVLKSVTGLYITSYILMCIGVIYAVMAYQQHELIIVALIFGGGGVYLNLFARKTKSKGDLYKKYIDLIVNQNQTSIDYIASVTDVSYEAASKDLQKMINSGYFTGAYIEENQRKIVLSSVAPPQAPESYAPSYVQSHERVVTCGSCGANNRVTGQIGECEYCGSPLQ